MQGLYFLTPQFHALSGFCFYHYDTLVKVTDNLLIVKFRVGFESRHLTQTFLLPQSCTASIETVSSPLPYWLS